MFRQFVNVDATITSNAMILNGVTCKSFKEIERDLVFGFKKSVVESGKMIIIVLVNSLHSNSSHMTKYWSRVLY